MTAATIRVLTWNVHRGIGADGSYDFRRIATVIERHAPDIVALQELDTRGILELEHHPLSILSASFAHHAVEARTIIAPDGHYGHALLSRWPIAAAATLDLTVHDREPRRAIRGRVETPLGPLRLCSVHLGLGPFERHEQVRRLLAADAADEPSTVLMGDFNDWLGRGHVRRALARRYGPPAALRTFPARRPLFALDRIYCEAPLRIATTWSDPDARRLSDHLPLFADIAGGPATAG